MPKKPQARTSILNVVRLPKKRFFASVVLTCLYYLVVMPINERIAFTPPAPENIMFMVLLKVGFFAFLLLAIYGALSFFYGVYKRDYVYVRWLQYSLLYLAVATVFFILLYPGHWVWDEFNILYAVQHYVPDAWQNIYTNIYYTFCLYLIPTGVSIVAFQGIIASIVVGYLLMRSETLTKKPIWRIVLFAVFVLPPIIINNLYPLRLTVYSYIEVAFLVRLLLLLLNKEVINDKVSYLLQMTCMIVLLAFWRTEGIYYLLMVPLIIAKLGYFSAVLRREPTTYLILASSLAILITGFAINKTTTNDRYGLTAMINPLSVMIQSPLAGEGIDRRLQNIDEVIDLKLLKKYPSYTEIPGFWAGVVRDDYQQHLSLFRKEYIQLVLDNPGLFLDARIKTFYATNGFDVTTPTPMGMLSFDSYSDPHSEMIVNRFYNTNSFSEPINKPLKQGLTRSLLFLNDQDRIGTLGKVFWNIIPLVGAILLVLIVSLFHRQWAWSLILTLVALRVTILFLTAPAHYFMYYLPVLMSGSCIVILWLSQLRLKRLIKGRDA